MLTLRRELSEYLDNVQNQINEINILLDQMSTDNQHHLLLRDTQDEFVLREANRLKEKIDQDRDRLIAMLKMYHEVKKNIEAALHSFALTPDITSLLEVFKRLGTK